MMASTGQTPTDGFAFPPVEISSISPRLQTDDILVFHPDGDVLIQIGKHKFLVSSEAFSFVSPVFDVMLRGGFREGTKALFGDRELHQVSLPEDNPDVVLLFCKILHNRENMIAKAPDGVCLLGLAVFCDKYQCTESLKPHLDKWIQKSLDTYGVHEKQNACTLLLASYINDSEPTFRGLSELILRYFREQGLKKNERLSWYLLMQHPLIDVNFASAFETKHKAINCGIDVIFEKPFKEMRSCTCQNNANVRAKKATSFYEQLFHGDLMSSDIRKVFITDIIQRVEKLPDGLCRHYNRCPLRTTSLKEILQRDVKWIETKGIGICLDCIKSNGRTRLAYQCRTRHY
jgi:hypothetical protein